MNLLHAVPVIEPEAISFITTYNCTSTCRGCCFGCSPLRTEKLSLLQMRHIVDEVISSFPCVKLGILTGGECFMLGEDMYAIIKYMHDAGLKTRLVTNGYWASSMDISTAVIQRLKNIGLDEINFSTGDYHQKYVSVDYVINGIISAIDSKMKVAVNVENHLVNNKVTSSDIQKMPRMNGYSKSPYLTIIDSIWIEKEQNEVNQAMECINAGQSKRCKQLFSVITISPKNELLCCCGLTALRHRYLTIGEIRNNSLRQMWDSQFLDILKIWLYTEGPDKIIEFVKARNKDIKIDSQKREHTCEKCMKILTNAEVLDVLKATYQQVLPRLMLEFQVLQKTKLTLQQKKYE